MNTAPYSGGFLAAAARAITLEDVMSAGAWHSAKELVFHNNRSCTESNNIETENLRAGSGGRRLCEHCDRLNKMHYRGGLFASLDSASV